MDMKPRQDAERACGPPMKCEASPSAI
jgi:hypothetical protein